MGCSNVSFFKFGVGGLRDYVDCFMRDVRFWWDSHDGKMMLYDVYGTLPNDFILDKFGHLNNAGIASVVNMLETLHFRSHISECESEFLFA